MNEIDRKDRALKRAEKKVARLKLTNNYRTILTACCATCVHSSRMSIEDSLECALLEQRDWSVNNVDEFGLCDKYQVKP